VAIGSNKEISCFGRVLEDSAAAEQTIVMISIAGFARVSQLSYALLGLFSDKSG
jgi:hypothetical protein